MVFLETFIKLSYFHHCRNAGKVQGNFLVENCCVNSSLRYKLMYQYENSAEEEKHALYFAKPVVVHCKNNLVKCLKVVLMGGGSSCLRRLSMVPSIRV